MIKRWSIKEGFTLAEVLITIGVIGIVSALTLPNVIQNTKKNKGISQNSFTLFFILNIFIFLHFFISINC